MAVKLVRDAIQEVPGFIEWGNFRKIRDRDEHIALLLKKIMEELGELIEAHSVGWSREINEEGCDLIEVLTAFLSLRTGMGPYEIQRRISQKQLEKGGFFGGLVWEHP